MRELSPCFRSEVAPEMQRMQQRHKKQQFSALSVCFAVSFLVALACEICELFPEPPVQFRMCFCLLLLLSIYSIA